MNQITEDYVSFEIAVLLKEKGFVGEREIGCRCGFYEQNKEYPSQINLVYDDLNNSELECNECLRFTHQMALKWLREVHKWSIQVFPVFDNLKWCYDIYELKIQKYQSRPNLLSNVDYDTYEEAVEAALKYTLENLIYMRKSAHLQLKPAHICRTYKKQLNCPNSTWSVKQECNNYSKRF